MKFICMSLLALCLPAAIFCQDINGLWAGTLYNDSTHQVHDYEIGISQDKGKYTGISKTSFTIDQKKFEAVKKIKIRLAVDGKIVIEDVELVFYNYPVPPHKDVKQLNILDLEKQDDQFLLSGIFVTNATKKYSPLTGKISLKRRSSFSTAEMEQYLQKNGMVKEITTNTGDEVLAKNEED